MLIGLDIGELHGDAVDRGRGEGYHVTASRRIKV